MTSNVFARIARRLNAAAAELDRAADETPTQHASVTMERLWATHLREDAAYLKTIALRQA